MPGEARIAGRTAVYVEDDCAGVYRMPRARARACSGQTSRGREAAPSEDGGDELEVHDVAARLVRQVVQSVGERDTGRDALHHREGHAEAGAAQLLVVTQGGIGRTERLDPTVVREHEPGCAELPASARAPCAEQRMMQLDARGVALLAGVHAERIAAHAALAADEELLARGQHAI